jgi:hypothetical protein
LPALAAIPRFQYNAASFLSTTSRRVYMRMILGQASAVAGALFIAGVSSVFANEPKGGPPDYSGISTMYYALIGVVLAYGVYDTFFKKS